MSTTFEAKYTSGDVPSKFESPPVATRRASLLTKNRAFDGYKITDRRERQSRRSYMLPDITLRRVLFIGLWLIIQAIVLSYKWADVASKTTTLTGFARATMACMMVSFSAIFLFMSPTLLELLRRTFISRYVVIEKNVHAHKVAAYTCLFWVIAHVVTYYYIYANAASNSKGKVTLRSKLFGSMVGKTGHAMIFLLAALFLSAIPVVRRKFHEVFYWMHHLFVPILILIFVHGSATSFQWYIIGPGAVYIIDRLYRFFRSRFRHPRILSVIQHPSNVIELKIERRGMKFEVGQYIYLNIPSISRLEWHPFTLTSAPEDDEISVHIWIAGDWTRRLIEKFQGCAVRTLNSNYETVGSKFNGDMYMQSDKMNASQMTGFTDKLTNAKNIPSDPSNMGTLKALADQELLMENLRSETTDPANGLPRPGTRGRGRSRGMSNASSTQHYQPWAHTGRNSVVLLDRMPPEIEFRHSDNFVHANPVKFADDQTLINLPTIMVDGPYGAPTQQVFDYEHVILIGGGIGVTPMSSVLKSLYYHVTEMSQMQRKTKKVYFFWVCRDIQALEWFQDLLLALDEEDIGDILEIRTYLTGQLSVEQIRNIALYQDPNGPDAVTGMYRSPTYYGRPNFDSIFENIGMRTPGADIGVFFCGPKPMGRTLRKISRKWTSNLRHMGTAFDFHKENF
ncbi:hypothetical protein LPJ53_002156 [Coemansia erecta]|uniref:FAD-binding FR-type domain-containing protein n=1 Tax=Coemansia erecta TaxID=147472 RepID=A0A9W7Y3W4_9FUNG|nr:hypothetical protein LPJ53_002156 [Coemansia erecta]